MRLTATGREEAGASIQKSEWSPRYGVRAPGGASSRAGLETSPKCPKTGATGCDWVRPALTAFQKQRCRLVLEAPAPALFPNTNLARRRFGGLCQRPTGGACRPGGIHPLELRYNNTRPEVKGESRGLCRGRKFGVPSRPSRDGQASDRSPAQTHPKPRQLKPGLHTGVR